MSVFWTKFVEVIMGCIGSVGFAILFNVRGKKLVAAGVGGLLSWGIFVLLEPLHAGEPLRYFIVAVLMSLYSEIMARLLKTPTTTFLMTSLIPLVPGGSLYYTMAAMLQGDWMVFREKGASTVSLAVALALGIVVTAALLKMINVSRTNFRRWRMQNQR